MKLIVVVIVSLTLLCSFCQSKVIIMKWPELPEIFSRYVENSPRIENIYLDYKQLCKAAQKSKLFIAEYEEKGAFKFLETNRSLPVVETSEFSRGKIQKGSIENILKIIQDEGSDLHSKFRTIQYGNKMKALWTVPCLLSNNKIIYFSNGFKNENINMHFIFGKVVKGEFLSLLAAIGKSQVEILSQQRLDCHYLSQLRNKSSMSNNIDLNHMEPTEYFWLCAIVHDHIVKSEVARNFKLLLAQQPVKTKTVLLHLKYPVSVIALQYKVYDMDNPTNYEILHILQDPADSIAVFVGKDDKSGWILLNNYFRIPSLLSV